jgi:exodeoxyribonuclease VII small subunit
MTTKKTPAKATSKKDKREKKFAESLAELEETVRKLEEGDVALEESLAAFEKGVGLVKILQSRLDDVEEKIEELTRGARGTVSSKPLEED